MTADELFGQVDEEEENEFTAELLDQSQADYDDESSKWEQSFDCPSGSSSKNSYSPSDIQGDLSLEQCRDICNANATTQETKSEVSESAEVPVCVAFMFDSGVKGQQNCQFYTHDAVAAFTWSSCGTNLAGNQKAFWTSPRLFDSGDFSASA